MNAANTRIKDTENRHLRAQELTSIYQRKEHPEQVVHPPQSTEHGSFVLFQHSQSEQLSSLNQGKNLRIWQLPK
jgi:hypothetical protein